MQGRRDKACTPHFLSSPPFYKPSAAAVHHTPASASSSFSSSPGRRRVHSRLHYLPLCTIYHFNGCRNAAAPLLVVVKAQYSHTPASDSNSRSATVTPQRNATVRPRLCRNRSLIARTQMSTCKHNDTDYDYF